MPGTVLSINSLGFRETANKVTLEEIDPYTVKVTRHLCKTEVLSIARQALTETRFGKESFDCTDAYATYIAHNITALGVPLLYDSVTGFNFLKERCLKRSSVYRVNTTLTDDVIKDEAYDQNTTVCKDLPVADVLLTAKIDDAVIYIATAADGVASLPPEKIAQLDRAAANASIKFHYEADELTTRHLRKKPEYPAFFSAAASNGPMADNVTSQGESPSAEISGRETALEDSFLAALAPSPASPVSPAFLPREAPVSGSPGTVVAANNAVASAPEQAAAAAVQVPIGRDAVGGMTPPAVQLPETPASGSPRAVAADNAAAPTPEQAAAAAIPVPVGRDTAGGVTPPAVLPQETPASGPPGTMVAADNAAAPAPEQTAAAAMPAPADRESPTKKSLSKIISKVEAPAQAAKSSRPEIKSAAPSPALPKTHSPVMVRIAPGTERATKETLLQQILVVSPVLNRLCCPLTEKLFWNIGD